MSKFTFKNSSPGSGPTVALDDGLHSAVIVQVADIGLQRPFDKDADPERQLAAAFELQNGEFVTKRMKFSEHPASGCFALFTAAYPDLDASHDTGLGLPDLLGKSVLIEVEVRDGRWPRVTAIMPLEDGFEPLEPTAELLSFDAAEMDREVYLKLHRDIRLSVSKRIRHA